MRYMSNKCSLKLKMRYQFTFILLLQFLYLTAQRTYTVFSPDNSIKLQVGEEAGKIYYSASKDGKLVLGKSFLGYTLKEGDLSSNIKLKSAVKSTYDETWIQPWGEEIEVKNHYNELFVSLVQNSIVKKMLNVRFRLFNDGLGFRYEFPDQKNLKNFTITDELTEFNIVEDPITWSLDYTAEFYEGLYRKMPLSSLDTVASPLTIESKNGQFLAIHEANLTDYPSMNLHPMKENTEKLKVYLTPWSTGDKAFLKTPSVSPWRTIIIADSAADLMLSRLMLNLNESNQIKDTSWIKPGKYIGIWWGMHMKKYTWEQGPNHGANTENVLRYIDFAAKHNFSGVLVEGWNKGWEDWKSFDFLTPYPDFDIKKITDYAALRNVKLIGHHETGGNTKHYEKQMDSAFAFYKKYGVDAVKTGYVGGLLDGKELHGSQYGVRHYRKVIENAARYKIMIDNHEPAMPTGLQRTFPNLMTQEGVRGQEWDAWSKDGGNPPNHTTIIPFTRGLAGPMDFTPGTFNFSNTALPNTRVHTTIGKQLALSVVLFSPLQMASDMIENYEQNPAFEFITCTPTIWSKTVVPHAKIGEYITVARRDVNKKAWYIGSITNEEARSLNLELDFLEKGKIYLAKIFMDGPGADYKSNPYPISIIKKQVTSNDILKLELAASGGTAIILTEIKQ